MNQFKMSLFLPPISPVKDSTTGRIIQPPTLTPYKEITLQEVYKLITSSKRLKTLTETVRRAAENGDEKVYRMLKQQTLPYVTPCGVFSYRKSDSLTGPSGLIVGDIDHLDVRPHTRELLHQGLVAPLNVVDGVNLRHALGGQGGKNLFFPCTALGKPHHKRTFLQTSLCHPVRRLCPIVFLPKR